MRTCSSAALLGLLLLTGCTSDPAEPAGAASASTQDLTRGACAPVAAEVVAVGAALPRLGDDGKVDRAVKDSLRDSQDRIFAFAEAAPAAVKPALDDLVLKLGIVRIRADGNSYEAALGDQLRVSYEAALAACSTPSPSTSPAPVIEVTLPPDLSASPGVPAPSPSG